MADPQEYVVELRVYVYGDYKDAEEIGYRAAQILMDSRHGLKVNDVELTAMFDENWMEV